MPSVQGSGMKLVFQVSVTQRLIFVHDVVQQLRQHSQRTWWQTEAGGALLGRHLLDSENIIVDEVTTPQKKDKRSRFGFFRSAQHSVIARARWVACESTMAYLGLWHTHPERDPTPSGVDRRDWENAVANDVFHGDRLFFPIVGLDRIRVWSKTRADPIEELIEVRSEDGP